MEQASVGGNADSIGLSARGAQNKRLEDPPSNFAVDNILADELNRLSFKDRQAIEEELHGVRCGAAEESPDLLNSSLQEFDLQVNARKLNHRVLRNVVYTTSRPQTPSHVQQFCCYLNNQDIRLRFLRSECFVVDKAVQRLIDFLEFTSDLFGDYVAERPIKLSDFNEEEFICLQQSRNQYLPFRDRSGRRVLTGVGNCNFHLPVPLRFKILMYLHWVVSEDVETQRKGVVIVAWVFDEANDNTWEQKIRPDMQSNLRSYHKRQNNALPVRVASLQQYYNNSPFFKALSSLYVFGLNSQMRSIYKAHFGSQTELRYKLSSYGVPTDMLPISCTGTVKYSNHLAWLNFLRTKMDWECSKTPLKEEIVECPRSYDVIFRKGPTFRNNPGNMYYRELIETNSREHSNGKTKREKYEITLRILSAIEDRNGRFLEWSRKKEMWILMQDRQMVRLKIAAALKQYKRTRKDELENTIMNAASIFEERTLSDSESSNLRRYYAMDHHPMKRKRGDCCGGGSNKCSKGDSGLIFGKGFFPTE